MESNIKFKVQTDQKTDKSSLRKRREVWMKIKCIQYKELADT